jgi:hypothetical protein
VVSRARTLRNVLTHLPPEQAAEALNEEFPWLALLPESDLPLFVRDFVKAVRISAELAQWGVLAQTLREWKATAAVYADPALTRDLTRPLADDHGPVPGPEE